MKEIYFYFQIHQPYRINSSIEGGKWQDFFVGETLGKQGLDMRNETIFNKVALNCYIPTTEFWLEQFTKYPKLKMSLSFSGTFLEQCLQYPKYGTKVLDLFKKLIATNRVEILDETYYHSLAFLVDLEEYLEQIKLHRNLVGKIFNYEPENFRNTELIYNNYIGQVIQNLGYKTILMEDAWWNRKSKLTASQTIYVNKKVELSTQELELLDNYKIASPKENLNLFLRNEEASDGIIFNADENRLLNAVSNSKSKEIGVFTDYEFMGEHSTEREKIFKKIESQISRLLESKNTFKTIQEVQISSLEAYDCGEFSSWGHKERDITVWRGGDLQEKAFEKLVESYWKIKNSPPEFMEAWRKLSTSCHLYFLGQKEGPDREFVNLFSPYNSVEEALEKYLEVSDKILELVKNR